MMSSEEIRRTLHELQVHQIELKMQNEELHRTQAELTKERERYFDLYNLAPVGYLTLSAQGIILAANLTVAKLLDVEQRVLLKRPLSRFISKKDQDLNYLHCKQLAEDGKPQVYEMRMVRKDKTVFWARINATAAPNLEGVAEYRVVLSDITELKQAKEEWEQTFNSVSDLITIIDNQHRVLRVNKSMAQRLGIKPEECVGLRCYEIVHGTSAPPLFCPLAQTIVDGREHVEEVHVERLGGDFLITTTVLPNEKGECIGYVHVAHDITAHKRAEEALRQSEQETREAKKLLDLVLDTIPVRLFWKDLHSVFLGCNRLFAQDAGYHSPEELIGLDDNNLSWAQQADMYRKKDFEVMSSGIPQLHFEEIQNTPDGRQLWLSTSKVPLRDAEGKIFGVLGAYEDITERLRDKRLLEAANVQLKEQSEYLNSIYQAMDSVGLTVCKMDENDCHIESFNPGAEYMFGYREEEVVGKSIALIYAPELVEPVSDRIEKLRRGDSLRSVNYTLVRKSGERFPALISLHPFDPQDGVFHKVVGIYRDISELILVQEQLKAANENLEKRVERRTQELQETQGQVLHAEKLSEIGKLSASIAHEFNNPLQGILSILKGLKKRAILEEEDKELLDAAINEGDRIKDLICSLQDFNRPSSGRKTIMDVHQSLDSILLLQKSDFNRRRISVVRNYAVGLPQILAVSDQMKQVFLNLLANAADACDHHGGVITISTWQEGNRVAVAVQDNGVGIKPEEMEEIFRPFYSTKSEVKGTGLGLSVSYGIVKKHQGEIRVESQPGEGATFTVLLPIEGASPVVD